MAFTRFNCILKLSSSQNACYQNDETNLFLYHMVVIFLQVLGSRSDRERQIEKDTEKRIIEIQENVRKSRQQALSRVLDMVYDIKPELHTNLRL